MATIEVNTVGNGAATLSVQSECNSETLARTLDEVSDLLNVLLEVEAVLDNLSDDLTENRNRAVLAVGMKVGYHMDQAKRLLLGQKAIAKGEETASQHGFPEFDDDVPTELFE